MYNPFAPPGETAHDLWIERINLNGFILAAITYGVLFTITSQTVLLQLRPGSWKAPLPSLAYISVAFVLSTIGLAGHFKFIQMSYIDYRNIVGGPNAFRIQFYHHWSSTMSFISYSILSWFGDALVLWRFIIIWNHNYWIATLPSLMYLGSIGNSIALIVAINQPNKNFWTPGMVKLGIPFWSLSISLDIILTLLIVGRLMYVRHHVRGALGDHHSNMYTSVSAMLIESAALHSIWGLVLLVFYARQTPLQELFIAPFGQIQAIAPMLILLRVAQGRAWSRNIAAATQSSLAVRPRTTSEEDSINQIPLCDMIAFSENSNNSNSTVNNPMSNTMSELVATTELVDKVGM